MEDRKLTRVFDRVKLPPEREDAILAELLREKKEVSGMKEYKKRKIPAALVAAVLVVVLAGTVFAANSEAAAALMDYLTLQVFSGGEEDGYAVTGSPMTKYPLSAFSPALLKASEGRGGLAVVQFSFDTWEETREFVGLDFVWPDGGENWSGPFWVYLFHTGLDQLWGVDITGLHTDGVVLGEINVQIRTEYWQGENAEAVLHDGTGEGNYTQLDRYLMANGTAAEIVQYTGTEDFPHAYCEGYFMRNGILYSVTSYGTRSTQEDMVSRLHAILDAYE